MIYEDLPTAVRERNARIAERFFGYRWFVYNGTRGLFPARYKFFSISPRLATTEEIASDIPKMRNWDTTVPLFHGDTDEAWGIVKLLTAHLGVFPAIRGGVQVPDPKHPKVLRGDGYQVNFWSKDVALAPDIAPTMEEAICIAALRWMDEIAPSIIFESVEVVD